MRQRIRLLQDDHRRQLFDVAGVEVIANDPQQVCPACHGPTCVQKTVRRHGATLSHGSFCVRETVRVCAAGCRQKGSPVVCRPEALNALVPPGSVVGYDVMACVGMERFVSHR